MTPEQAATLSAVSAAVNTVAVLVSLGLVIWTSFFRKTRRDKIDELKVEMLILFSEGWDEKRIRSRKALKEFFRELNPKFRTNGYKALHQCAFDELGYEGRNPAFRFLQYLQERYESGRIVTREGGFVE